MHDLTGQDIGRYHILEPLGEGGMAKVFKAYDTQLERDVAIKLIRMDQFGSSMLENIRKRFDREAKTLAKLSHPNIVGIYDYGEFDGTPYLVMEYLPGGTLKQKMGKPIPYKEAIRLVLPIASALIFAHKKDILHRDVKPINILMTASDEPMLTDFGIAKILDLEGGNTLTGTGVGIGTPQYMAPEQGAGKEVDERADIYSLGIVLYELLTGRTPFNADTPLAVIIKQMNDSLPRPKEFVPGLPDEVEKILFKALAKQPEDRYQSMSEFSTALYKIVSRDEKYEEVAPSATVVQVVPVGKKEVLGKHSYPTEYVVSEPIEGTSQIRKDLGNYQNPVGISTNINQSRGLIKKKNKWLLSGILIGIVVLIGLAVIYVLRSGVMGSIRRSPIAVDTPAVTATPLNPTEMPTLEPTQLPTNMSTGSHIIYIIQEGDTLALIATKYNVSVQNLMVDNGINEGDPLVVGQAIMVRISTLTPATSTSPSDLFEFVRDVTIPDGAVIQPNEKFTKTWRVKNTGTTTWTSSYSLSYSGGYLDPTSVSTIYLPANVYPGQMVDISIDFVAPAKPGTYRSNWLFCNPDAQCMAPPLYVLFTVSGP